MNRKIAKVPKALAKAEITPRNKSDELEIYSDTNEVIKTKVAELDKSAFELGGVYPILFDAINYVCTHHKEALTDAVTHYAVDIPKDKFLEIFYSDWSASLDQFQKYTGQSCEQLQKGWLNQLKSKLINIPDLEKKITAYRDSTAVKYFQLCD